MAMIDVDGSSLSVDSRTVQVGWLGLRVGGHLALSLHSSNEPGELSSWSGHEDNTVNIVIGIIITTKCLDAYI